MASVIVTGPGSLVIALTPDLVTVAVANPAVRVFVAIRVRAQGIAQLSRECIVLGAMTYENSHPFGQVVNRL
jgi:hypothetical protein